MLFIFLNFYTFPRDDKLLASGTCTGEIFLWSFFDYSFIQQLSGNNKIYFEKNKYKYMHTNLLLQDILVV